MEAIRQTQNKRSVILLINRLIAGRDDCKQSAWCAVRRHRKASPLPLLSSTVVVTIVIRAGVALSVSDKSVLMLMLPGECSATACVSSLNLRQPQCLMSE